MNPRRPEIWAFTILELMVVVTIITVLLALLTPAIDKAMDAGQKAKCASNLHSIHVGISQYATQNQADIISCRARAVQTAFDTANPATPHNGSLPEDLQVDWLAALASAGLAESTKSLTPDGGSSQHKPLPVWQCPSTRAQIRWDPTYGQYETTYSYMGGIGRREWIHSTTGVSYRDPPSPAKFTQAPGSWMLAGDLTFQFDGKWDTHLNHGLPDGKGPAGSNQVFMDGAAEWVEREKLFVGHTFWLSHFVSFMFQNDLPEGWVVTDDDRPDAFD